MALLLSFINQEGSLKRENKDMVIGYKNKIKLGSKRINRWLQTRENLQAFKQCFWEKFGELLTFLLERNKLIADLLKGK